MARFLSTRTTLRFTLMNFQTPVHVHVIAKCEFLEQRHQQLSTSFVTFSETHTAAKETEHVHFDSERYCDSF
jgi:hypothetical protein